MLEPSIPSGAKKQLSSDEIEQEWDRCCVAAPRIATSCRPPETTLGMSSVSYCLGLSNRMCCTSTVQFYSARSAGLVGRCLLRRGEDIGKGALLLSKCSPSVTIYNPPGSFVCAMVASAILLWTACYTCLLICIDCRLEWFETVCGAKLAGCLVTSRTLDDGVGQHNNLAGWTDYPRTKPEVPGGQNRLSRERAASA